MPRSDASLHRRYLTTPTCTTDCIHMSTHARAESEVETESGPTEVWQARIARSWAAELRADAAVLGLDGRTEIVRAALKLLHQRAAELRMAQDIATFYGADTPPLPVGVTVEE